MEASRWDYYENCNKYFIGLVAENYKVWLNEEEMKKYDFKAMPSNGEFVPKKCDKTPTTYDSDDDTLIVKKKAQTKKQKITSSTSSW